MKKTIVIGAALFLALGTPAFSAPKFSFGDDSSEYSNDGECDDPRFEGAGMTSTPLLEDDVMADASDCRAAFEAGRLTLRGIADDGTVDFGDDASEYANDGECDDLRFRGAGMTGTPLLEDDVMHDATDCKTAYSKGQLELNLK
ncbi:MAG: hypothetical protein P0Y65_02780 [Candidatus Devosia phytovorans]|uniref:Uncharacterized protein n=1 Tax=Candidatus Devosia phytovorans TaxID=3121372 RepID=A0AAJ6B1C5_9HYPH|nr:hypothetical protein [Devosia sp.]WEK05199.1 MAG: hypothetical protein P0Y65_02780 [Devosia sp.]